MSDDTFGPSPRARKALEALDMSVLCRDWTPTLADRETVASLPLDKELTLSVSLASVRSGRSGEPHSKLPHGVEEGDARTLILSAFVDEVVLFELRFWDGKLVFQPGTAESQESKMLVYGADAFDFQVGFDPVKGGLAIAAAWIDAPSGERQSRIFTANISNLKLPKAKYYTLRLGAPKHFVDLSLLGWRVNATYDLALPIAEEELPGSAKPYLTAPPRPALVEASPLDTLRLALQSIDSWRKVAEDALQALEGEGKC